MKQTIRVIVPCYNEEAAINAFHNLLTSEIKKLKNITVDILYVDDGSIDNTLPALEEICKDPTVSFISFSRNFGKEIALTAGINQSSEYGAIIMMDADGQHPPNMLGQFIDRWRAGSEVVVGMRTHTDNKAFVRRVGARVFNTIVFLISGQKQGDNHTTDYRLLDKKVVLAFMGMGEHNRITRGLIDWMGFRRDYVDFIAPKRSHGKPTYNTKMLFRLAMHAFVSQSTRPLKFIGALGVSISVGSFFGETILLIYNYALGDPYSLNISGTFHAGMLLIFMVGVVLSCQGLIALYIENIYIEVRDRPLYFISHQAKNTSKK